MKKLLTSMTMSLALIAAAPAIAQEEGYSDPAAAGTQKTNYDESDLKQFVEAQEAINEIRDEYITKIENTDSQEKAQSLQMEANDQMAESIDDAGLDIPTYNAIATAYNSEPEVRERVDALK